MVMLVLGLCALGTANGLTEAYDDPDLGVLLQPALAAGCELSSVVRQRARGVRVCDRCHG